MKRLITLGIAVMFAIAAFGQNINETKLPKAVLNAFKARFPNAKDVKWEKEDSAYSAEFLMDDAPTETEFDSLGEWKNTEWNIPIQYTPAAIKHYTDSVYSDYILKELTILEVPTDSKSWVAEMSTKNETVEVYFTITPCVFKKAVKMVPGKKKD